RSGRASRAQGNRRIGRGNPPDEVPNRVSASRPRVLVAASYPAMRAGIRLVLERDGHDICAEADDAPGAVAAAGRERPEPSPLPPNLRGGGIEAVALIKAAAPETSAILLARAADVDELVDALRAGASGYVPEGAGAEGIARAVGTVRRGDPAIPREL